VFLYCLPGKCSDFAVNVTAAQEMLFKKLMKPVWSDEELQKLIETRATVNTVPPTAANKIKET
jgi:hypothetical protein